MLDFLKLIGKLISLIFLIFVLLFTVYFFNLDMKLTAMLQPLFEKHYDKIERNRRL